MIHVLVSFNLSYMQPTQVMLYSLCTHTDEEVTVWLLNQNLSSNACADFSSFIKKRCKAKLQVVQLDTTLFDGLPVTGLSVETYSRVLAQQVLPIDLDRVLWLDGDIVVHGDIAPFYHQNFGRAYCVACKDNWSGTEYITRHQKDLGIPDDLPYFNSGVLLLNLKQLHHDISNEKIWTTLGELKDRLLFHDQDILNYLYAGHVKFADNRIYNCQRYGKKEEERLVDYNQVIVIHYTGVRKPWDIRFLDKRAKYYWQMYVKCFGAKAKLHCIAFYIGGSLFAAGDRVMRTCFRSYYDKLKAKISGY